MDSRTGELLTVADYPTFNANKPADSPRSNRISRALQRPVRARLGGEGAARSGRCSTPAGWARGCG